METNTLPSDTETQADDCPACGSRLRTEVAIHGADRVLPTPGEFDIRVCPDCGTGKTFPIATEDELGAFYEGGYANHEDVQSDPTLISMIVAIPSRIYHWRARNFFPLSAVKGQGRFLDVGCGNGWIAELFVKEGWDAVGIELTEAGCAQTAARGVEVHQGTINTVDLPEGSFDAVLFYHALEHTVDPAEDLANAIRLLAPGGKLLVAVPNFASHEAKSFGRDWFGLELPRHRTHFTPKGLKALLESQGLVVDRISTGTPLLTYPYSFRIKHFGQSRQLGRLGSLAIAAISIPLYPFSALYGHLRGGAAILNAAATKPGRAA